MVKIIDIRLERDLRETNILEKDLKGNPIKFKQSEFIVGLYFDNKTFCVIEFKDIAKVMELICNNEEYKYPNGLLGRNMPFYKFIFPLFEKELLSHGFNPEEGLLKLKKIEDDKQKKV